MRTRRLLSVLATLFLLSIYLASDHLLGGSISGTVARASDGGGIDGVQVWIYDIAHCGQDNYRRGTLTDSSGNYSRGNLDAGYYCVETSNNDYIDEWYDNHPVYETGSGNAVYVYPDKDTPNIDFELVYGGAVSGDLRGAGTLLSNQEVILYGYPLGGILRRAWTDALGHYRIGGLPAGPYRVGTNNSQIYVDEYYDDVLSLAEASVVTVDLGSETGGIDFDLIVGGFISGRVTDEIDQAGIDYVEIRLYDNDWNRMPTFFDKQTSSTGAYMIRKLPPGSYYLLAFANRTGYVSEYYDNMPQIGQSFPPNGATPIVVASGESAQHIDFELTRGGSISGRVTRPTDGQGVYYVFVRAYTASWEPTTFDRTDQNGYYQILDLPAGSYFVQFWGQDGWEGGFYNDVTDQAEATAVAVVSDVNTPSINFVMKGSGPDVNISGSISGRVTAEEDGRPLYGVRVYARDLGWNTPKTSASQADGTYTIGGVPPGEYYVSTSNTLGYIDESYDDVFEAGGATRVTVKPSSDTPNIDFVLEMGAEITGRITSVADSSPVGAYAYVLDESWDYVRNGFVDQDGYYSVAGLRAGTYYVGTAGYFPHPPFVDEYYDDVPTIGSRWPPPGATPITVNNKETVEGVDFELDPSGSISGRVTDADTGEGKSRAYLFSYDENWKPFWALFDPPYRQGWALYGSTNSEGYYSIGGLPTGDYFLTTYMSGIIPFYPDLSWASEPPRSSNALPISVITGEDTPDIDFAIVPGGSISGTVTDSSGQPLPDIDLEVLNEWGKVVVSYGRTLGAGTYSVENLPTGSYYLRTTEGGPFVDEYYPNAPEQLTGWPAVGAEPIPVTIGMDTQNIDIVLEEGGLVYGRVVREADGWGLYDIEVTVYDLDWGYVTSSRTTAAGDYKIGGLLTADYYIQTRNDRGWADEVYNGGYDRAAAGSVAVSSGAETEVNFSLAPRPLQPITYTVDTDAPFSYLAGSQKITQWQDSRIDGFYDLPLSDFDFRFYGTPVSGVRVSVNGYLTFGTQGMEFLNEMIPSKGLPQDFIAPFWDDLSLEGLEIGRGVWWGLVGTAPFRRLVVEWRGVPSYPNGTESYCFEVVLQESLDRIKLQYLDVDFGSVHDGGASASVGIENYDGSEGYQYSFDSMWLQNGTALEFLPSGSQYLLTTVVSPEGSGTVTGSGINCPSDCTESVNPGTNVELTAAAIAGFSFVGWGGDLSGNSSPAAVTVVTDTQVIAYFAALSGSTDGDGQPDSVEMGPGGDDPSYDGDGNGVPDYQEERAVSLPSAAGDQYLTVSVPASGPLLSNVQAVGNPSPGDTPEGANFGSGFLEFSITGLAPGGSTLMTLNLDSETTCNTYYKFGATPDNATAHWYQFLFDGTTGAEILGSKIYLHLVDGLRGDDDILANGEIQEPGGPASLPAVMDLDRNQQTDALTDGLLVLRFLFGFRGENLVTGCIGTGCERCSAEAVETHLEAFPVAWDVDGDGNRDALTDGLLILRYLFGFRGSVLISGAVSPSCIRCQAAEIETFLKGLG